MHVFVHAYIRTRMWLCVCVGGGVYMCVHMCLPAEDTSRVLDQGSEASDHVAVGMQVEVLRQARPASLVSPREGMPL